MNKLSLHKIGAKPKAMLTAASISLLAMSQSAEAAVTWNVTQTGANVTVTTDGGTLVLNAPSFAPGNTGLLVSGLIDGLSLRSIVYVTNGAYSDSALVGLSSGGPPLAIGSFLADAVGGDTFGSSNDGFLVWDAALGSSPLVVTPDSWMVFNDTTIATMFGTTLDSGPVTIFTAANGGDSIKIALVPEPSSTALLGLGGLALLVRRRRSQHR